MGSSAKKQSNRKKEKREEVEMEKKVKGKVKPQRKRRLLRGFRQSKGVSTGSLRYLLFKVSFHQKTFKAKTLQAHSLFSFNSKSDA